MSDCSTHAFDVPLRECPFCGCEAHTIEPARYGKSWGVRCECGAFLGFEYTEAEAIAAWNARAERTCKYIGDEISGGCSECRGWLDPACAYCPTCGAKVVSK